MKLTQDEIAQLVFDVLQVAAAGDITDLNVIAHAVARNVLLADAESAR